MAGNTHWNEANLAVLKRLGKQGKLAEAARLFHCTENAARIKYGRITRADSFSGKIDVIVKASAKKLDLKTNTINYTSNLFSSIFYKNSFCC